MLAREMQGVRWVALLCFGFGEGWSRLASSLVAGWGSIPFGTVVERGMEIP